jgi:hypothetical protein
MPASADGVTLASGESTRVRCAFPAPGPGVVEARAILRGADPPIADTLPVRFRVGAGPLQLNEIAFHDRGAGEWVEVLATEDVPDLGAFALSDAGSRRYPIDRGPVARGARKGDLLVIAESRAALRAAYGLPDSVLLGATGWPALNDTDGAAGFSDRVRLWEPDGLLSDAAPYRADAVERDASLERLGSALPSGSFASWSECGDAKGGTPGRPNSMTAPTSGAGASGTLLLAPTRVLRPSIAPLVLSFGPAARGCRVRVIVHDLLGRTRRRLADGQRITGEAALVWDGKDDEGSEPARHASLALTVVER